MLEDFKPFIDKFNLIAQKDSSGADGGDSTHRFGIIVTCLKLLGKTEFVTGENLEEYYNQALSKYYDQSWKLYRRHPDSKKWYSSPFNFSRDQFTMLTKAMIVMRDTDRVRAAFKTIFHNKGFFNNIYPNYVSQGDKDFVKKTPDIMTPSQISDYIRGTSKSKLWYPVLCAIDALKFLDIYLANKDDKESKTRGKRTDYFVMLATDVAVARHMYDTVVMRAVAKSLSKTDYKSSIEWIFSPQFDDPPIHKLLIPVCEKYIDASKTN